MTLKVRKIWGVIMEDDFKKLTDIIEENNLFPQTAVYLVGIKIALEEKEKLEQALDLACEVLDIADGILFDLYDRYLDTYYDTKDKHEWKNYLLESVEDNE